MGDESTAKSHERSLIAAARAEHAGFSHFDPHGGTRAKGSEAPSFPPDVFGGYRIVREFHRGGQGVVYEAHQKGTERRVAIKVLREGPLAGLRDKERFEREIEVLGQLKHPNIVTIHHSGETHGCYYFVMDFVAGEPLDRYARKRGLSTRDTLRLFERICRTIHTAHLHGIIHRDLKPGNIRMDERDEPRVLDFGLAKITPDHAHHVDHANLADQETLRNVTATGQFVGSLPWASPEQANGVPGDIDLRTDVYSLGVILFHLLTWEFPYQVVGNMRDVLGNILDAEPVRPSSVRRTIDEDVDTIVLKCLAKEPDRRYQSAASLAEDVDRYLTNQPIQARAPSTMYQLQKLVQRNKMPFAFLLALFALITGCAIWMSVLYTRAEAERIRAVAAEGRAEERGLQALHDAATADAVNEFLIKDMLASARPEVGRGRTVTVQETLDNASERIEKAFGARPLLEASIRAAIGESYIGLGIYDSAEPHLRTAAAIYSRQLGGEHADTLSANSRLVDLLYRMGSYAEATPLAEATLNASRTALGEEHEVSLEAAFQWARLVWIRGELTESRELIVQILEARRRILGNEHPDTIASLNQQEMTRYFDATEAADLLREALNVCRQKLGEDHPETLRAKANLGYAHLQMRNLEAAENLLAEALATHHRVLGSTHPDTLVCTMRMALLRKEQDRVDEAEALFHQAWETGRHILGDEHTLTTDARVLYGSTLIRHGKNVEAAAVFRKALEVARRSHASEQRWAHWNDCLSLALTRMGRFAEAERGHRVSLELHHQVAAGWYKNRSWSLHCMIRALEGQGKEDEARPLALELLDSRRKVAQAPGADAYQLNCYARDLLTIYPPDLRDPVLGLEIAWKAYEMSSDAYHYNRYTLALAHEANGDLAQAVEFGRRALDHIPIESSEERVSYESALVRMLERSGSDDAAEDIYRQTLAARRDHFPPGHEDIAESLVRLGETLIRHGGFNEADPYLHEALEIRQKALPEGAWQIGEAMSLLGACLAGQDGTLDAESLLVEGYTILVESPMGYSNQTRLALARLEEFLSRGNRPEDARSYRSMLPAPVIGQAPATP